MAVDAGSINSEVRLLLDDLKRDVVKVEKHLNVITKASKKTSKESTSAFASLKNVLIGIGALQIGRKLAQGFGFAIRKATDAVETTSKLRTVYKDLDNEVDAAILKGRFRAHGKTLRLVTKGLPAWAREGPRFGRLGSQSASAARPSDRA